MKARQLSYHRGSSGLLKNKAGFTLMELLMVVAVIALIVAMVSPTLSAAKRQAQGILCLQNLRQLQMAWTAYATENGDKLPGVAGGSFPGPGKWVSGWLDFSSSPDNTNTFYLLNEKVAQLGRFLQTPAVFKCPADKSSVVIQKRTYERVRSVSMNCWMNYIGTSDIGQDRYQIFRKLEQIVDPAPSRAWVFMDERPDSINDGLFMINMTAKGKAAKIVDYPANYHNQCAGMAFVDGHVQMKKWVDNRTVPHVNSSQTLMLDIPSPDNPDVEWLQERSTSLRKAD